jgi:hypothetical protein
MMDAHAVNSVVDNIFGWILGICGLAYMLGFFDRDR